MRSLLDRGMVQRIARVPESGGRLPQPAQASAAKWRRELPVLSGPLALDEMLVVDPRSLLRPAQLVERKLIALLKSVYLPMSHVRATTVYKGRGPFSAAFAQPERKWSSASFVYAGP
jgi:hypothetical protein